MCTHVLVVKFFLFSCALIYVCVDVSVCGGDGEETFQGRWFALHSDTCLFLSFVCHVIYIQHRLTDSLFLQIMQGVRGYNNRMAMFQFKKLNAEKIKIHSNS